MGGVCLGGGEVGFGFDPGATPGGRSSEPSGRLKPCMSIPINTPRTSISLGSPFNMVSARAGLAWMSSSFCLNEGSARCFEVRGFVASLPRRLGSAKSFPRPRPPPLDPAESFAARKGSVRKGYITDTSPGSRSRPFASWTSFSPFLRGGLSSNLRPSSYAVIASSYCLEPWRAAPFRA